MPIVPTSMSGHVVCNDLKNGKQRQVSFRYYQHAREDGSLLEIDGLSPAEMQSVLEAVNRICSPRPSDPEIPVEDRPGPATSSED